MAVTCGVPFQDRATPVDETGFEQHAFRQSGLARTCMTEKDNVFDMCGIKICHDSRN
jgi:hypothetical protein